MFSFLGRNNVYCFILLGLFDIFFFSCSKESSPYNANLVTNINAYNSSV